MQVANIMESTTREQMMKQQLRDKNPNKMENLIDLPKLGDRRLSYIHRKVSRARKNIIVHNERMKLWSSTHSKSIDRDKQVDDFLNWQKSLPIKRSLLELRGLQKCLKRKREETSLTNQRAKLHMYGIYEGKSLVSFRPEIQSIIDQMHPRERRLRKVEQMKMEGRTTGRLVDYSESLGKFNGVIQQHQDFLQSSFAELRERTKMERSTFMGGTTMRRDAMHRTNNLSLPSIGKLDSGGYVTRGSSSTSNLRLPRLTATSRKVIHGEANLQPKAPRANTLLI